jgi:hypothetical protein
MHLCSDEYASQLRGTHESHSWGNAGKSWLPWIIPVIDKARYATVLDYGCGRGSLKPELLKTHPHLVVQEYDPGIVGKDSLPFPADIVVCTDVMEHIEPKLLRNVLLHLAQLSEKELFLNISCKPSKVLLPDGRNSHLIIRPVTWWMHCLRVCLSEFKIVPRETVNPRGGRLVVSLVRTSWKRPRTQSQSSAEVRPLKAST